MVVLGIFFCLDRKRKISGFVVCFCCFRLMTVITVVGIGSCAFVVSWFHVKKIEMCRIKSVATSRYGGNNVVVSCK